MENIIIQQEEPICALATANGVGAIAVVRVSGFGSIEITNTIFKGRNLTKVKSHTVHFGTIREGERVIDEVLVTVFRSPASFTKEDSVEISCHGSDYIIRTILKLLIKAGARMALPGEFTQRAYLNGQFDLVQAEAVADLIAADNEASHRTALHQLRGGFSRQLASLREELIHFASLVELELDFGEEDVEFAGRDDLRALIHKLNQSLVPLIESFDFGNSLKEGIPVAIIGAPNVGKSTLLNALLNEEKAIVTDIAGTTRDVIEDTLVIGGIKFRIIDTAGIRETQDVVESIGIERSKKAMEKADIVLLLFDQDEQNAELDALVQAMPEGKEILWVRNKADLVTSPPSPLSFEERGGAPNPAQMIKSNFADLKNMTGKVPDQVLENARHLRRNATEAERFLWDVLRNRQFEGHKFRRQHPVEEGFVLDFFCAEYRLGLELDGDVHEEPSQRQYDQLRAERLLELYGIEIVRLSNREILDETETTMEKLRQLIVKRKNHLETTDTSPRSLSTSSPTLKNKEVIRISASTGHGLDLLRNRISQIAASRAQSGTVVTNLRHYEHLLKTHQALNDVLQGLDEGVTGDFLAQDIRLALFHLGEITGTIVTDDLLANIFSKFCIGK